MGNQLSKHDTHESFNMVEWFQLEGQIYRLHRDTHHTSIPKYCNLEIFNRKPIWSSKTSGSIWNVPEMISIWPFKVIKDER